MNNKRKGEMIMKYFKKLVGERIYLSPRNAEDVEQFTEWMNDFEVTDYIGRTSQMISLSGEKEFLEKNAKRRCSMKNKNLRDDYFESNFWCEENMDHPGNMNKVILSTKYLV